MLSPLVLFGMGVVLAPTAVTKARTTGGDQPLDGKDVFAAVAPLTPNLRRKVVERLREASEGTPVHVGGVVSLGSRTYELRRVDVENASSRR